MLFIELRRQLTTMYRILDGDNDADSSDGKSLATRLSDSLCALARSARATGLTTYCSLTLHVLEQLASAKRTGYVPVDARSLVEDWVKLSAAYLSAPTNFARAADLIEHMGNLRWERPVCRIQRQALLAGLQVETFRRLMSD